MNFFQIEKSADMEWGQIISLTQLVKSLKNIILTVHLVKATK